MDLRKLKIANEDGVPLYTLKSGTRYKYIDLKTDGCIYTFVKHSEYEFPLSWLRTDRKTMTYTYKIAIPESIGHQIIFVADISIVQPLDFV